MPYSIGTYKEVYERPSSQNDPNKGIYAWGDSGERTDQRAYNFFRDTMGREPTQGQYTGQAYLNQLRQQETNDPNNPNSPYNARNPKNKLAERNPEVQGVFQELLKRGATQDELNHFSQLLATGQADAFTLKNFVSQLPEYRQGQDKQFREGVASELEGYDTKAFGRQKQDILSYYANQGMPAGTSPSLDYALTDLMGKIAEKRQSFLTGLSADQYSGNKGAAREDYNTYLGRSFEGQDWGRNRGAAASDYLNGRLGERQDYQTQMMDYNNMNRGGSKPLGTRDWINIGLGVGNTAAQAYGAGGGGRRPSPSYASQPPTYY